MPELTSCWLEGDCCWRRAESIASSQRGFRHHLRVPCCPAAQVLTQDWNYDLTLCCYLLQVFMKQWGFCKDLSPWQPREIIVSFALSPGICKPLLPSPLRRTLLLSSQFQLKCFQSSSRKTEEKNKLSSILIEDITFHKSKEGFVIL